MGAFQKISTFEAPFQQDASGPAVISPIPDFAFAEDTGTHEINFSSYFFEADTFTMGPAPEAGWSLDADTGILIVDTDDTAVFGPYSVTATGVDGTTESNAFLISVVALETGSGSSGMAKYLHKKNRSRMWR
jgi:hypothetical protein